MNLVLLVFLCSFLLTEVQLLLLLKVLLGYTMCNPAASLSQGFFVACEHPVPPNLPHSNLVLETIP